MIRRALFLVFLLATSIAQANAASPACETLRGQALEQAGFIVSYPDEKSNELGNVAFLYDNAVATIALVGCGDVKAAARIGDAMLAAQNHDRYFRDGRLRNAYPAGRVETQAKLTGWWDAKQNMWVEDQYQVGSDTGNNAWAMLALLSLHKAGAGERFLKGAIRIGTHLEKNFDARSPTGFTGGAFGGEPRPRRNRWKSTEHNADLAAAYALLADATKDERWRKRATAAKGFVTAMWMRDCRCFAAGTGEDGKSPNRQLALDAQVWPLLALPDGAQDYADALSTAEKRLSSDGGFAYGEASKGFWTEGTAQAALLTALLGRKEVARELMNAVERNRDKAGNYYATGKTGSATGFGLESDPRQQRRYFRTPHLAALGWAALAQAGFNPFTGTRKLP